MCSRQWRPKPNDRYATAEALSLDLQRFLEDRPIEARRAMPWERFGRWCRRNPALAGTSAIASLLLIAVAIVSTVAYLRTSRARTDTQTALVRMNQQHARAQGNADLAWDALDRIFERFAPQGFALDVGAGGSDREFDDGRSQIVLSDEAASQLSELIAFYGQLREQDTDNPELRRRIGLAHRRAGDIYQQLGDDDQSAVGYQEAAKIYEGLLEDDPSNGDDVTAAARAHNELGRLLRRRQDHSQAMEEFRRAEELLVPLVETEASAPARFELARNYYFQLMRPRLPPSRGAGGGRGGDGRQREGHARGPGRGGRRPNAWLHRDSEAAEQMFNDAAHLLEELTDAHPGEPEFQHLLGLTYMAGASLYRRSDPETSNYYWQYAVSILKELDALHKKNPEYAYAVCRALATGSPRDESLTETDLGLFASRLEQARMRSDLLIRAHSNVPQYREQHGMIHHKLGTVMMRRGRVSKSELAYRDALDTYTELTKEDSTDRRYRVWAALVRQSLAGLLAEQGGSEALEEARDLLLASVETLEPYLESDSPYADALVERLYGCRRLLAGVYAGLGEKEQAEALRDENP